jgi:hypothetical protein
MSYTQRIKEKAWSKLYKYLTEFSEIYGMNEAKCRKFVEGVFWLTGSGGGHNGDY